MINKEQYKLLKKIGATLSGIFDCIFVDEDNELNEAVADVERNLGNLMDMFEEEIYSKPQPEVPYQSFKNCVILRDTEDGEISVKAYNDEDCHVMMRDVSNIICFSDCDPTVDVVKIIYCGREVEYCGWRPGMVMEYQYVETGDEAWSGCFPQWDH